MIALGQYFNMPQIDIATSLDFLLTLPKMIKTNKFSNIPSFSSV